MVDYKKVFEEMVKHTTNKMQEAVIVALKKMTKDDYESNICQRCFCEYMFDFLDIEENDRINAFENMKKLISIVHESLEKDH